MFVSDTAITEQLRSVLKLERDVPTPSWWDALVARAHADAYNAILDALLRRGYVKAQIDIWARGAEFETSLSLFWLLTNGTILEDYKIDTRQRTDLDRRGELATVSVFDVAGNLIDPVPLTKLIGTGKIKGGYADASSKDPYRPSGPFIDEAGRIRSS